MVAWNDKNTRVAIVAGVRTPFAKIGGPLRNVHVTDLAKTAMGETLNRANWPADRLDEVLLGNVVMPADATNPARVSAIWAGIPNTVPAMTVQRNCASGIEAIADAAWKIRFGQSQAILAGGAESMSTVPLLFPDAQPFARLNRARNLLQKTAAVASLRPRHFRPVAALERGLTDPTCGMIMGKTAELLAKEFGISRAAQDEFALRSHQRATAAVARKIFDEEITPVYVGKKFDPVTQDVGPRQNQTIEALAKLPPIFDRRDGTVTVGNSCQVTDGAVAVLAMDEESAASAGLKPLGFIRGYACVGLDPSHMGLGPVFAIDKLLRSTGISLDDVDLFEINEAFAAQVLACLTAMASADYCAQKLDRTSPIGEIDPEMLNVNGGAIALGHPVGATGARLVLTLLLEMRRRNIALGIAALCVGGGQGVAMLLERR